MDAGDIELPTGFDDFGPLPSDVEIGREAAKVGNPEDRGRRKHRKSWPKWP